jgi:hypothetical protein
LRLDYLANNLTKGDFFVKSLNVACFRKGAVAYFSGVHGLLHICHHFSCGCPLLNAFVVNKKMSMLEIEKAHFLDLMKLLYSQTFGVKAYLKGNDVV